MPQFINIYNLDYSIGNYSLNRAVKVERGLDILESIVGDEKVLEILNIKNTIELGTASTCLNVLQEKSQGIWVHKCFYGKIEEITNKFKAESICDELCIAALIIQRLSIYAWGWHERRVHGSAINELKALLRNILTPRLNNYNEAEFNSIKNTITIYVGYNRVFDHGDVSIAFFKKILLYLDKADILKELVGYSITEIQQPTKLLDQQKAREFSKFIELTKYEILVDVIDKAKIFQKKKHNLLATLLDFCNIDNSIPKYIKPGQTEIQVNDQERDFLRKNNLPTFKKKLEKV